MMLSTIHIAKDLLLDWPLNCVSVPYLNELSIFSGFH